MSAPRLLVIALDAIAAGPGIVAGERLLHDLVATICAHFGQAMPPAMRGIPIAPFLERPIL